MSDRKKAIETLKQLRLDYEEFYEEHNNEVTQAYDIAIASLETDEAYQLMEEQPTIIDWNNCHTPEQLESISTTKNDLGVDCISRADVLKLMQDNWHTHNGDWAMQESMDDIRALPAVHTIRPKGHWEDIPKYKDIAWQCSECEHFTTMKHNFCPNCGVKMIEPQESEDNNAEIN